MRDVPPLIDFGTRADDRRARDNMEERCIVEGCQAMMRRTVQQREGSKKRNQLPFLVGSESREADPMQC